MSLQDRDYMREGYRRRPAPTSPGRRARLRFWLWRVGRKLKTLLTRRNTS
jgi:hypothetical protein